MHIVKNERHRPQSKQTLASTALIHQKLSTALASLSLVFVIMGALVISGLASALATENITPDSTISAAELSSQPTNSVEPAYVTFDEPKSEPKPEPEPEPEPVPEYEVAPDVVMIDSAELFHNPEFPNGCEITALTAAMVAAGYDADQLVMADGYQEGPRFKASYACSQVGVTGAPTADSALAGCNEKPPEASLFASGGIFFQSDILFFIIPLALNPGILVGSSWLRCFVFGLV